MWVCAALENGGHSGFDLTGDFHLEVTH